MTAVGVLVIAVAVTATVFGGNPLRPSLGAEQTPGPTTTVALPVPTGTGHGTTGRSEAPFPDQASGVCPAGTVPIPRLRITLSYDVPPGRSFAIDSFPDQQRKAVTDHFDFENLMPEPLMSHVVDCINTGRTC